MSLHSTIQLAQDDPTHSMLMTMGWAISAGVMLVILSRRLNLPAIVMLLAGGAIMGPSVLGLVQPDSLGNGLRVIVSLSIGLILFEGGLTLDVSGYRQAPAMIKRLLTIGVLTTWFGTALAIQLIMDVGWQMAIISGSLVIVTGPTVIAPLLKRIKLNTRLHNILHWEGVLIDPIGVFIALLCYEWMVKTGGEQAVLNFGIRLVWGLAVGAVGGLAIMFVIRRKWIPEDTVNVFALGAAVLVFALAEVVRPEAGLLAVTAAGFFVGFAGTVQLKQLRQFKAEITDLLIGTLFILLASRLSFEQFQAFGWTGALVVGVVMLVIRPVSVFLCSLGTDLSFREKGYLAWVAPRGIVAASMASLISLNLATDTIGGESFGGDPTFVESFTYSVIIATIVLQGFSAGPLARLLGLKRPVPTGWMIVGANALARRIARFIGDRGEKTVVLADTNARLVREAQGEGLVAVAGDARDTVAMLEHSVMAGVGNVLALTDNEDLNVRICQNWAGIVGPEHVFRCNPGEDASEQSKETEVPGKMTWPKLPKPSLVAAELQRGEAAIIEATGYEPAFAQLATPLITIANGKVSFDPPDESSAGEQDGAHTLYVQRRADYLMRAIRPELITKLKVDSLEDLLRQTVELVVTVAPELSRDETVEELLERETSFPTALGHGVAVPHAYCPGLDARLCAIAQLPDGFDFNAPDQEPVRLAFLLLSPQGDPEGHLATLADIARLVIDPQVRHKLFHATSPMEMIATIRQATASK